MTAEIDYERSSVMGLEKIKYIMKIKGLTAEMLSQKSGVPKSTINKITSGVTPNPRYETVKALANALDLNVDELSEYLGIDATDYVPGTIAAHHDDEYWTAEELDEIERFKAYVKSKRK